MLLSTSIENFQKEYNSITKSFDITEKTQASYKSKNESLQKIFNETTTQINDWKKDKISASNDEPLKFDVDRVLSKADQIRTAIKVIRWAAIILGIVAKITLIAAGGWVFIFTLFDLLAVLLSAASPYGRQAFSVLPGGIKILTGIGIASTILSICSCIAIKILNCSKTFREERAIKNDNFKEFVDTYVKKDSNFNLNNDLMTDRKLHEIYLKWESSIRSTLNT